MLPLDKTPEAEKIPWKEYSLTLLKVWLAFSIATFALGVYLTHLTGSSLFTTLLMVLLYVSLIVMCIRLLIKRLSVAALMLLVPIAPLAVLLLIISILPILQRLQ